MIGLALLRKPSLLRYQPIFRTSVVAAYALIKRNLSNLHPLFKHFQLTHNVWRIEEKYFDSWNLANIYFVRGTNSDFLVDTGVGLHYLPSYLLWSKVI